MILIDVHAHLNHVRLEKDLPQIIERARKAGVKKIIVNGINDITNREALALSKKYDIVECAFGAYPIDALNLEKNYEEEGLKQNLNFDIDKELEYWKKHRDDFIAIGEVGLDYKEGKGYEEKQKEIFQKIIRVAEELNKPIIVHTRKAEKDAVEMLMQSNIPPDKIILHCFGGKKALIKEAADYGMNFSIPPIINRLQHFQTLVSVVPITQLLTETDSPWLGPERDKANEPANVIITIKEIAKIKKFTAEEVANTIFMRYQQIFG